MNEKTFSKKNVKSAFNKAIAILMTLVLVFWQTPIYAYAEGSSSESANPATEQTTNEQQAQGSVAEGQQADEPAVVEQPTGESAASSESASDVDADSNESASDEPSDSAASAGTDSSASASSDSASAAATDKSASGASTSKESADKKDEKKRNTKSEFVYEDSSVKVTATLSKPEVLPEGVVFQVTPVTQYSRDYNYGAYMQALNNSAAEGVEYTNENTMLYDMAFIAANDDGKLVEVQPENGTVNVNVSFKQQQLSAGIGAEESAEVEVNHLPLKDDAKAETTAESTNVAASDVVVEGVNANVSVESETASFVARDFSVYAFSYTVDFTYGGYTYSFPGQGSYALADVFAALGIQDKIDSATLALVEGEAVEGDLYLTQSNGAWYINSDVPFTSTYELSVKCGNATYVISITDSQESTDLSKFLTNVAITGATQNSDGRYVVEEGKEYSLIASFAENVDFQFANDQTLTYQMPLGITVLSRQTGNLTINIVYKGRTYQVGATYELDTDGKLKINFDQNDPDYPQLEASTNVSFRFTYKASFDGAEKDIVFNDAIERDIIFDEPEPGQAYANKTATFDETTGKFNYTITVSAVGDVTNVNVKDVISGDALVFNNDVQVTPSNKSYTNNGASNGFDYTFASMADGEVIKITYSASVNFDQDDGDGKITADQTKNTVTVEPEDGPPHTSEYSHEINYKTTKKSDGTDGGTTPEGNKIVNWSIDYNQLALAKAGGDTITDTISSGSRDYMTYYGSGITVEVRDHSGTLVDTRNIPYDQLTSHEAYTWTYTIPDTDTTPYSYHITYQTVVDMEKVNQGGVTVSLSNDGNGDGGGVNVTPKEEIGVTKDVESFTTEEVNWVSTLNIPEDGLAQAVVTDTLPTIWLNGANHYDLFKEGSLQITGLLDGESYTVDTSTTGQVKITFFKDRAKTQTGLQGTSGGHTITVRLTTKVDQEWLQAGYDEVGYKQNHTNTINLNGKTDTATVTFGKPGIEKKGVSLGGGSFKYTVVLSGVSETPVSVLDQFDTRLLEIDTSKASSWDYMRIFGGNQYSQDAGRIPISYSETSSGVTLTADSVPMQDDGQYYPYYKITYYLKLKQGVDLEQLAIASEDGVHHLINTAKWGDHETEYDYKTVYDYLDKKLLNETDLGETNRTAKYQITFNPAKATLNQGEPMEMKDVLSSNLSIDYSSIQITTDPAGASVPYSLKGGEDGTTIATYTVPDSTKVTITYDAMVTGNGSQTIVNKVTVNGKEKTITNVKDYGAVGEGEGAVASFKAVKVDGYDANKKLEGVRFKLFGVRNDPGHVGQPVNLNLNEHQAPIYEIELVTDRNGEITLDGDEYAFHFNTVTYHLQEIEPKENYGTISFDYLVTLTNDMSLVDYGHYIYYYSDSMQIKNWPLEGLIVEKQVESDDEDDLDRYYDFKISILNDDGSVNEDYNEKNGDDQFQNGMVEFSLKNKEQKMFWGFLKGTKYKVEEVFTDAEGNEFTTTVGYDVFDEEGNIVSHETEAGVSHSGTLTQEDEVIVFKNSKSSKGSLKVKKNVTVNGAATETTLADGTYYFDVYKANADGTKGDKVTDEQVAITVTNGVSNEASVSDLEPGDYIVSEDTSRNPANVSLTSGNDVKVTVAAGEEATVPTAEFTNNKDLGGLKIKKNVTVNGAATETTLADGTYYFDVYKANADGTKGDKVTDEQVAITVTNGVSNEASVSDLEPGDYIVSEDTSRNPANVSLTSGNDVKVTVAAGEEATVPTAEFTNNKDLGGLKIKKNVTVNGAATETTLADGTYYFDVYKANADGTKGDKVTDEQVAITVTNGVSNEASVSDLEPGDYIVSEDTSRNPANVSLTSGNDVKVTVAAGEEATVPTAEFTNNKDLGGLKIKKNVTVNGAATETTLADGTYYFDVYKANADGTKGDKVTDEQVAITVTNGVSNEASVSDLEPGDYIVSEDTSRNPANVSLTSGNDVKVTVAAGEEATVPTAEFTNNKDLGGLKIKKNVTVNGAATETTLADGTYYFDVYKANADGTKGDKVTDEQVAITVTNGVSNEASVSDLEPGDYIVSEDTSRNPANVSLTSGNDVKVTVAAGEEATVPTAEFTNNKDLGGLKIKKNVTVNGAATETTLADGTYYFDVYKANADGTKGDKVTDEQVAITVTNGVSNEASVSDLEPGDYIVSEDTSRNPANVSLTSGNDVKVTVAAGEEATVPTAEFTNNKDLGGLKIKKNVTVNGAATETTLADGTYYFDVYKANADGTKGDKVTDEQVAITVTNGVSNEASVSDLEPGDYIVSEDTSRNPANVSLTSGNDVKVTVAAGEEATVPTAEFTNNKDLGGLKIKKNVTVNGAATETTLADGTYYFDVYKANADGTKGDKVTDEQVAITVTNGVSNEASVSDLEPGDYIVSEDTSRNPANVSLTSGNDVKVTVAAGEEATVPTAEFTNNKDLGGLKIKKNVTVNGAATETTLADGTYYFDVYKANADGTKGDKVTDEQVAITVTNGVSNEASVSDLEPGDYIVSEDTSRNPANVSLTSGNDVKVTVAAGEEATVPTAEFTNNKDLGGLKIKKNVTVNGAATETTLADGTYYFDVYKANADGTKGDKVTDEQVAITVTNGVSNEASVSDLEPGDYIVSEDTSRNPANVSLTSGNDVKVTVAAGEEATVPTAEFTNNKDLGGLKIKKNVTVNGAATETTLADGTYYFDVYKANADGTKGDKVTDEQVAITVTNGVSNEASVSDLEPGDYIVSEDTSRNPANVSLTSGNDVKVTVAAGEEATVPTAEFTNNKDLGGLKIKKNVTVNGAATETTLADGTYYFDVYKANADGTKGDKVTDEQVAITVTNGVSNEASVSDLEPGDYIVSEDTSRNPANVSLTSGNDVKVTVAAGEEATVPTAEFTNNKETVNLGVKKEWKPEVPTSAKVTLTLYKGDSENDAAIVVDTIELDGTPDSSAADVSGITGATKQEDAAWHAQFKNLPKYEYVEGADGAAGTLKQVYYVVKEADADVPSGFGVSYTTSSDETATYAVDGGTVTNTEKVKTSIPFRKAFYGTGAASTFEFKFKLTSLGEAGADMWTSKSGITIPNAEEATESPMQDDGVRIAYMTSSIEVKPGVYDLEFGEVQFDADGDYYYAIEEVAGNDQGVVYDEACYLAHVTIKDNEVFGDVEYHMLYPNGDDTYDRIDTDETEEIEIPEFYNNERFIATLKFRSVNMSPQNTKIGQVSVYPEIQKTVNYEELGDSSATTAMIPGEFKFELRKGSDGKGDLVAIASNDESGRVAFFDEAHDGRDGSKNWGLVFVNPGTYEYTITEQKGTAFGVSYDDAVILMTVEVTQADNAELSAKVTYSKDGTVTAMPTLNNTREGMDLEVYKRSRFGNEGLVDCTYALWMHSSTGDVMLQEATSDATGRILFENVVLIPGQEYFYKEVEAPKGHTVDPYRTAYWTVYVDEDGSVKTKIVEETADDGWHSKYENIELDNQG